MRTVPDLPYVVREIEHLEIPLADGCRLAARIWMPVDAHSGTHRRSYPAVLEYIPYRKNDMTAARDVPMHGYVAGYGYACVRVDLRGTGDSEGVLRDEYLQQELDDGVEVIEWIARQSWCNGRVGMMGISWGGFNGLQIAALAPPALKAVITCCSTDDRYADDVHYMGGCLLAENISWASVMFAENARPPDPRNVGARWRSLWQQRLEQSGLWLETWLQHQHRDEYWKHGSVCEDFSAIKIPVYAVSGWADGYCNSVFHLLEKLNVPRKGLIGPWAHKYPHIGAPGPAIGFLQECVRWWDQWLKGEPSGIMDEPMLRVWIQDSIDPSGGYETRPGRWVVELGWPTPNVEPRKFGLGGHGELVCDGRPADSEALTIRSPLTVGLGSGKWCSYAVPGDQPVDQRADDAGCLIFETEPLAEALDILGSARVEMDIESDAPDAMVAVRLNDIAPNGAATRVSYGLLNLTHRDSHEDPEPLVPGQRYRISVSSKHVGQRFAAGHRIRLAISTSYWPVAWPSPAPAALTLHTENSGLELPVRGPCSDGEIAVFAEPEGGAPLASEPVKPADCYRRVVHDLGRDRHVLEVGEGSGAFRITANRLDITSQGYENYAFQNDDYASLSCSVHWEEIFKRDGWQTRLVTDTTVRSDAVTFFVSARLQAFESDTLAYEQNWEKKIPRRLV